MPMLIFKVIFMTIMLHFHNLTCFKTYATNHVIQIMIRLLIDCFSVLSKLKKSETYDRECAVRAAAASIYSTCNLIMATENVPCFWFHPSMLFFFIKFYYDIYTLFVFLKSCCALITEVTRVELCFITLVPLGLTVCLELFLTWLIVPNN